jgi:serine/threonine protein phosphatase PrpC
MSQKYRPSPDMLASWRRLLDVLEGEPVPDPDGRFQDTKERTAEQQRFLHVLTYLVKNECRPRTASVEPIGDGADGASPMGEPPLPEEEGAGQALVLPEFEEPAPDGDASAVDPGGRGAAPPAPEVPSVPPRPPPSEPKGVQLPSEPPKAMPLEVMKKSIYLRNARVGEPYEGTVDLEDVKGLTLDDDGGVGLTLDETLGRLTGTPRISGDFVLRFRGLFQGRRCEVVANLAVIPDPKSLWVSKDSDRRDPFWKPDEAFQREEGDLLCVGASKRGRSHAKDGTFRDDDFGLWCQGPGGWHVAVLADGAGSAPYARRGSQVAVESVLQSLPKLLEEVVTPELPTVIPAYQEGNPKATQRIQSQLYQSLATAAFGAARAIEAEAAAHGERAGAFSTTLVLGVARKVPEGWFLAGFSVGDGGAAVFDVRDRSLTTLTLPDSGEFAGQTRFLQTSEFAGGFEEVSKRIFFDLRPDFTAFVLMTDGISDPKFPTESVFGDPAQWVEFWERDISTSVAFSRENPDLERQFLDWLDFWSPGNHDDRTIAVLLP